MSRTPSAPFEPLHIRGESITLDTVGKVLVLPTGNADFLPLFNEYVLSSNRLTDDFGGLTGSGSPDYMPGTLYTPTDGVYLTDVAGNNSTKTLTAGKLKELNYLTVDTAAHTISEEFIISNTSLSNNPVVIDDCSNAAGWTTVNATGTFEFSSESGILSATGISSSTGTAVIQQTYSLNLAQYTFIGFKVRSNLSGNIVFYVYSDSNLKAWYNRIPIPANTWTTYYLPIRAPSGTSGVLPNTVTWETSNYSNITKIKIGVSQVSNSTPIVFSVDHITADTSKSAYIELQTPNFLSDSSLQIQAHNGTTYQTIGTYKLDSTYSAIGTPTSANWVLAENSKLDDVYGTGLGRALFPKNISGATSTGSTGTMIYSANAGTKNRIGLMVQLPPSDGGRTNFNKIRLKTVLSYAQDTLSNYSSSYEFSDSTNASYGIQNLTKPWLALYDPATTEIDFYLFTYRPKNLLFKRDETGIIHEITLYPGNGLIYHGRITYAGLTTDTDSNLIPDCLEASIEGSVTKFLQSYGMVI